MTAKELFSFDNEQSEIVWMSEAIAEGMVEAGTKLKCVEIVLTTSEKGFMLVCETPDGQEVYDWLWRKSKAGKQMFGCFEDPTELEGVSILVKAQTKVKAAVLSTEAEKGCTWAVQTNEGRTSLKFMGKPALKSLPKPGLSEKSA